MSDHLGETGAALVDGELGHEARDKALAHLARCTRCRSEIEQQRAVVGRLRSMTDPVLPADLAARLLAMPTGPMGPSPLLPSGAAPRPATFRAAGPVLSIRSGSGRGRRSGRPGARPSSTHRSATSAAARPHRLGRRPRRALVLGGSGMLLGIGLLAAVGGGGQQPAVVDPDSPSYVVEHVSTSTEVPLGDPGMTAVVSVSRAR